MAAYADTIEMEGATANDYEAQLEFLDPTADITITVPTSVTAAVMVSSLTTNGIGAANSVTGGIECADRSKARRPTVTRRP